MSMSRSAFHVIKDMSMSGLVDDPYAEVDTLRNMADQYDGIGSIFEDDRSFGGRLDAAEQEGWLKLIADGADGEYQDEPLLAGLLCAAYPGNLAKLQKTKDPNDKKNGQYRTKTRSGILSKRSVNSKSALKAVEHVEESLAAKVLEEYPDSKPGSRPWLLYTELVEQNKAGFLRNTTVLEPWQVAVFAGRTCVAEEGYLELDGWLQIKGSPRTLKVAQALRAEIEEALMWKALSVPAQGSTSDHAVESVMERVKVFFGLLRNMITGRPISQSDIRYLQTWEVSQLQASLPDASALRVKTVVELRAILRELGLKVSGKKEELVERCLAGL